ncbi:MAG: type III-B CRISPR-associated protein Cas10/Cmr2 [candidate division Zixibacteria bacterium]|jgi:CRISPR-associated protein Cmr2|nr:type III-B CRISPR-associated protein Cas10/Cmr2 [candidate division Zixibacteria bacterium]
MPTLLALSLGPVQGFIAAARRTRDLWFGSFILSEISKSVARCVHDYGGQLIFPAPQTGTDLQAESAFNVSNIILARLDPRVSPGDIAESALTEAQRCWKMYADQALQNGRKLISENLWGEQVDDVLEFYAAWCPLSDNDYRTARTNVMRLLAGRKACRDFLPAKGHAGIPKSSLDGARESVLACARTREETRNLRRKVLQEQPELMQRLRLSVGEELDAVAFTKRAAIKKPFPSVSRVAADPWIRGIERDGGGAEQVLKEIADLCRRSSFSTGSGEYYRDSAFPFDGEVLYRGRLGSLIADATRGDSDPHKWSYGEIGLSQKDVNSLEQIKTLLSKLQSTHDDGFSFGEPNPYLAVLVADGDKMGKLISSFEDEGMNIRFSQALSGFASEAKKVVAECQGFTVYTGGDDVLGFVPVDQVIQCAERLHEAFGRTLSEFEVMADGRPTLSIGVAICHFLESLEDILRFGRDAERAAKNRPEGNGLAIHLYPRSGAPILFRDNWSNEPAARMERWISMLREGLLSDRTAYDLRDMAVDYAGWPTTPETTDAIKKDLQRLLKRKSSRGNETVLESVANDVSIALTRVHSAKSGLHDGFHLGIMGLAQEWLIARSMARAYDQAAGQGAIVAAGGPA